MSLGVDQELERRLTLMRQRGQEWAEAEARRQHLDHLRHSVLADLMIEYEGKGYKTAASQDTQARADQRYKDHLAGLEAATQDAVSKKIAYKTAEIAAEAWRTEQASQRQEKGAYGAN